MRATPSPTDMTVPTSLTETLRSKFSICSRMILVISSALICGMRFELLLAFNPFVPAPIPLPSNRSGDLYSLRLLQTRPCRPRPLRQLALPCHQLLAQAFKPSSNRPVIDGAANLGHQPAHQAPIQVEFNLHLLLSDLGKAGFDQGQVGRRNLRRRIKFDLRNSESLIGELAERLDHPVEKSHAVVRQQDPEKIRRVSGELELRQNGAQQPLLLRGGGGGRIEDFAQLAAFPVNCGKGLQLLQGRAVVGGGPQYVCQGPCVSIGNDHRHDPYPLSAASAYGLFTLAMNCLTRRSRPASSRRLRIISSASARTCCARWALSSSMAARVAVSICARADSRIFSASSAAACLRRCLSASISRSAEALKAAISCSRFLSFSSTAASCA